MLTRTTPAELPTSDMASPTPRRDLWDDQESNSKERISTTPTRDVETPRQKVVTPSFTAPRGSRMSREQDNKAIVGRWFEGFWGNPWNPEIIAELAAPDMLLQYSLHAPRRGR